SVARRPRRRATSGPAACPRRARRPSRALDSRGDPLFGEGLGRRELALRAATRGVLVASAAKLLGDGVDVDVALRAHAHAPLTGAGLLEKDDGKDLLHREWEID